MMKYGLILAAGALALTLTGPGVRADDSSTSPAPRASDTAGAPPAAAGAATWYLAQLDFDDPAKIPAIADYKGPFDSIVAGAFADAGACEAVKAQFIEVQKKSGSCSDPASCKAMAATFDKALQCVTDTDPRWGDTPPEKRWFLFFGAVMPEGKCRPLHQVLADRVASIFSSPDEAACKAKGVDYADSLLGKPSERPSPTTPDCTYCIRGDDPVLRTQP